MLWVCNGSSDVDLKNQCLFLQIPSDKLVKLLNILEKNIQDGSKLSTMMNHVSALPPFSYFSLSFSIT